ncbi:hypothetical protein [Streptomyces griseorubiginosus]|uniref:hypothetical protein n=1 Tax=Streptomyces griseorubiginosus TaxID=67304 RepID=UPI0036E6D0F9
MTSCLPAFLIADNLRDAGHADSTKGTCWRPGFRVTQASPRTVRLWHDGPDEQQHLDAYTRVLLRKGYFVTVETPKGKRPRVRVTRP